ncbi:MAG: 30S ribosomal protein S2 [Acidipila sp.]|nr:30S ribosomal protein S2 [Acidipila sp.]
MKELLEAGVHFGHQTRRWNPKMKEFIFGERNGIHIIDLQKTLKMFREAARYVTELSAQGRTLLFVGTKRQAQEAVAEEAKRCNMYYVNTRWLGGTLTNWATLQKSLKRLKELKTMQEDGRMAQLSKKEAARLDRELKHLLANLAGIEGMAALPDALFIVDSNCEEIAVKEARRMGIPVVAIVDTNCDPDVVDAVIPGNDDALRAIRLFTSKIADAVTEGRSTFDQAQLEAQKSAEAAQQAKGTAGKGGEAVEVLDSTAYEEYEKQEGYDRPFDKEGAGVAAPADALTDAATDAAPEPTSDGAAGAKTHETGHAATPVTTHATTHATSGISADAAGDAGSEEVVLAPSESRVKK